MNEMTFGLPQNPISLQLPDVTDVWTTHTCAAPSTGLEVPITHRESIGGERVLGAVAVGGRDGVDRRVRRGAAASVARLASAAQSHVRVRPPIRG